MVRSRKPPTTHGVSISASKNVIVNYGARKVAEHGVHGECFEHEHEHGHGHAKYLLKPFAGKIESGKLSLPDMPRGGLAFGMAFVTGSDGISSLFDVQLEKNIVKWHTDDHAFVNGKIARVTYLVRSEDAS